MCVPEQLPTSLRGHIVKYSEIMQTKHYLSGFLKLPVVSILIWKLTNSENLDFLKEFSNTILDVHIYS